MDDGLWTYRGNTVLLASYDGFTKPSTIALDTIEMWIQFMIYEIATPTPN